MEPLKTPDELRAFELKVFDLFKDAKIASPVHLRGGLEILDLKIIVFVHGQAILSVY